VTASSEKFVLVELDYPQKKELDAETIKQNKSLDEKYKITRYPTILLCDASGKPYAQTGFLPGGPEIYSAHLETLREIRVKRDAAFAKAEASKENAEKASALIEGLKTLEENLIFSHYVDIIDLIAKLDPTDKTGYVKACYDAIARKEAQAKAEAALVIFAREKLEPMMEAKEFDKAISATNTYIKENPDLSPETKEELLLQVNLASSIDKGDIEYANMIIDQFVKEHSDGYIAKNIEEVKDNVADHIKKSKNGAQEDSD
jgi:hypothetical protein